MRDDIKKGLADLLRAAEAMSSDVSATVEEILQEGLENPLSPDEVRALLNRVVEVVREGATRRGDQGTVELLDREAKALIERVEEVRVHGCQLVPQRAVRETEFRVPTGVMRRRPVMGRVSVCSPTTESTRGPCYLRPCSTNAPLQ